METVWLKSRSPHEPISINSRRWCKVNRWFHANDANFFFASYSIGMWIVWRINESFVVKFSDFSEINDNRGWNAKICWNEFRITAKVWVNINILRWRTNSLWYNLFFWIDSTNGAHRALFCRWKSQSMWHVGYFYTYITNNMGKVISCLLNVFTKISNENGCEWVLLFNYVKVIKGLGQILEQDVTKTKPWKQANLFKLHSFIQSTYQVYMVDTIDFVYLWYGMRVNTQMHDLSI